MQRAILVITDNTEGGWLDKAVELWAEATLWEILPLGISEETYAADHQGKLDQLGMWRFCDIQSIADSAQEQIREFLPGFIFELPRQALGSGGSLFDLLKSPKANLWWFLEISEKSPLRGRLVNQLYFLALIRAAISQRRYDEVWCAVADKGLARSVVGSASTLGPVRLIRPLATRRLLSFSGKAWVRESTILRYFVNLCRAFVLNLHQSVLLRLIGSVNWRSSSSESIVFFSFYPAWWHNPYGEDPAEIFVQLLPAEISRRSPVCYAVWLTLKPFEIWKRRNEISQVFERLKMIPLQGVLGLRDCLCIISPRHLARLLRFRFRLANHLRASFAGFNVAELVVNEIHRSMTSSEFFLGLLMMRAFESLTQKVATRAVVYRVEFQPFEKAILAGIRGRTIGVAFQHSTFVRNYLPYFFVPGELQGYNDGDSRAMPLPYLLVTSGRYAREIMARNGFEPQRLEVSGPVRYARLLEYRRTQRSSAEIRRTLGLDTLAVIFLVATSVMKAESLGLLIALRHALETLPVLPYVVFKSHPAMPLDSEFLELVGPRLESVGYRVLPPDAPIYEYVAAADGVLLSGSTVGWEAMLLGVVPIVFESLTTFPATSMSEIEEACFLVHDASELSRAMRWTIDRDARIHDIHAHWDDAVGQMFDQIYNDPNERFIEILAKHGLVP